VPAFVKKLASRAPPERATASAIRDVVTPRGRSARFAGDRIYWSCFNGAAIRCSSGGAEPRRRLDLAAPADQLSARVEVGTIGGRRTRVALSCMRSAGVSWGTARGVGDPNSVLPPPWKRDNAPQGAFLVPARGSIEEVPPTTAESAAPGQLKIASTSAIVSSSRSISAAAAFSRTCSGRDAPTIAAATFASRRIHASASCAIVSPSRSAIGRRR